MNYFFDNNLSPHLAHAIRELSLVEPQVDQVCHLADRFARNAKDQDWITALAAEGRWTVVSQDTFQKNDLEREALRRAGLIVFALDRQWNHHPYWEKAHNLVKWWPSILAQSLRLEGGAAFRVPWRQTGGGRFTQIRI